jgi:para-aminobenzoate synthetase component 1
MASFVQIKNLDPAFDVMQAMEAFEDAPFVMLFDSVARHRERDARYTFLTADPVAIVRLDTVGEHCGVSPPVQNSPASKPAPDSDPATEAAARHPFTTLREWQKLFPTRSDSEQEILPPFCGGIAGLMSYELGHAFERIHRPAIDDFETPPLLAGLFDWAIVWDHIAGTVRQYVLPLDGSKAKCPDRAGWITARLQRRTRRAETEDAARPVKPKPTVMAPQFHRIEPTSEIYSDFTRDEYVAAVAKVIEYIRAGDIFQANMSQRLMAPWTGTAMQLYANVRRSNPAPFCGLLTTDDFSIVSASPERFLKVDRQRQVETRPIKGTRRRPRSPIADLYASDELSTSEKDRAENVMIVDLLRNDISRSCKPGTVRVTGLCEVERFETVLHLVSTVVGTLRDDCDVWDLMAGCFPGGSITGAPKIRAMEIIAELEPTVRGAYCGSLFFLGPCGDFDSSILIRTFTLKDGLVHFPVGGGIVADSVPLEEYRETLHKASGMIRSLHAT